MSVLCYPKPKMYFLHGFCYISICTFTKGHNWTAGIYSSIKRPMIKNNPQMYCLYIIYLTIKGLCWWGVLWDTSLVSAQNNSARQTSVSAAVVGRCGPESQGWRVPCHDSRERERVCSSRTGQRKVLTPQIQRQCSIKTDEAWNSKLVGKAYINCIGSISKW